MQEFHGDMRPKNQMVKFSIIVPVYNTESYLEYCLDSIIKQSYANLEIILIDDGSTDSSPEICDRYARKDDRIVCVHKKNGGLSEARNVGIDTAKGTYILFVDSDDFIEANYLQRISEIVSMNPVDVILCDEIIHKSGKATVMRNKGVKTLEVFSGTDYLRRAMKHGRFNAPAWLSVYRRSFWKAGNYYFRNGILHEDMQLLPIVLMNAKTVLYSGEAFYHHIYRFDSITHNVSHKERRYKDAMEIYKEWKIIAGEIEDAEFKRVFRGMICKCFINTCALNNIYRGEDLVYSRPYFIWYALNLREFVKGVVFATSPGLYRWLWNRFKTA